MNELIRLRRELHKIAELSGMEKKTSLYIIDNLKKTNPNKIIKGIGGFGVAAEYLGKNAYKTILLRADLDALPINETNKTDYTSQNKSVSHKCGHDGHMTILLGLAKRLNKLIKELNCRVILLFQPAEETAEGALAVINDEKFKKFKPDFIFGLHNLPGFPIGSIIQKKSVFSSASKGLCIKLEGMTSHAAHPENGNSPLIAMISILQGLITLPSLHTKLGSAANITIIHARLGEIAFGTYPGEAEIMATFRSHSNSDMELLSKKAEKMVSGIAKTYNLKLEMKWLEIFPSTINDDYCNDIIINSAKYLNKEIINPSEPLPWSEDFGWYLQKYKGAFFGIGSGVEHPQLHNSDYDFPDEIIETGIDMFEQIIMNTVKGF
ncbi:MAG: amidohydrolase [bacterium]